MNELTMGIIYSIKKFDRDCPRKQAIINFLSRKTNSEKECYTDEQLKMILRQAFIDYLKTADKPYIDVMNFFECKRSRETFRQVFPEKAKMYDDEDNEIKDEDSKAIIVAFDMATVWENGKYINGFSKLKGLEDFDELGEEN